MGRSQHVEMHSEITVQSLLYQVQKAKNQLKEQVIRKKKTCISSTNPILWFRGQAKPIEWFLSLLKKPKGLNTCCCHFSLIHFYLRLTSSMIQHCRVPISEWKSIPSSVSKQCARSMSHYLLHFNFLWPTF